MDFDAETEKRRFDRIANQFLVHASKADHAEAEDVKKAGIVHDINEAGLSFLTEQDYVKGDVLELEIEMAGIQAPPDGVKGLLNSAVVIAQATVVRTGIFEFGPNIIAVHFNDLEKEDRALILRAIMILNSRSGD